MRNWLTSQRTLRRILFGLSLAGLAPVAAHAEAGADLPMELAVSAGAGCAPGTGSAIGISDFGTISKTSALLGGAPSELDRIRLAQEGTPALAATTYRPQTATYQPQAALSPAAAPPLASCQQFAAPAAPLNFAAARATGQPGDILASKRLAIGHTTFDAEWARVGHERLSRTRYERVLGAVPAAPAQTLERVNAWVNRNIAYVEDRDLFGRGDYWAGAARTLKLQRGDCEDIALTKLQLLAAAGFAREDLILTIARDLVRGADHAVLMVKQGDRYVMLDNATDAVLDATQASDYRPVFSFGPHQAWLHGYQSAALSAR